MSVLSYSLLLSKSTKMGVTHYKNEMPELVLDKSELRELVIESFASQGTSFQFDGLCRYIAHELSSKQTGFVAETNTIYQPILNRKDVGKIREIIWDLIVLRYLSIGDYYNDTWPYLSITALGSEKLLNNL